MLVKNLLLLSIALGGAFAADWKLIWADEFNGAELDDKNWVYETGCDGWGNNEQQCYTEHRKENVRVEGGNLVIEVKIENFENKRNYTSGRLRSKGAWAYGRYEAKARLPSGKHLWPAIWMYPNSTAKYGGWPDSGEIDIMEMRGNEPTKVEGTIHYYGGGAGSGATAFPFDFSKDFHVFTLEWEKLEMRWLVDGKEYHKESLDKEWLWEGKKLYTEHGQPFDPTNPFFWVLNVAVGGAFFGTWGPYVTPTEAADPAVWPKHTMEVDYLRVYQFV